MRAKRWTWGLALGTLLAAGMGAEARAQGFLVSPNGLVAIGVNREGHLNIVDAGLAGRPVPPNGGGLGLAYGFSGQGGRSGWQDALTPGCLCEAWGVAGNGLASFAGFMFGIAGLTLQSQSFVPATSFTSVVTAASGLTVTHRFSLSNETGTGALFRAEVAIENTTGGLISDVRYARAMDWDIPPSEFEEFVEHKGVGTTTSLLRATDNGFALPDPMVLPTLGILAPIDTEGDQGGVGDHGSYFIFGFGDLAPGAKREFNIFYGAGANLADALALLSVVSPELYSLGFSSTSGPSGAPVRAEEWPVFIFAFNNVGGSVVVPPPPAGPAGVPAPAALWLVGLAMAGLGAAQALGRRS